VASHEFIRRRGKMEVWKREHKHLDGTVSKAIDIKQLISRLAIISSQNDLEIIRLAIQSIIDELQEGQYV